MQQQIKKFDSIAEETVPLKSRAAAGLTRSNSVAQGPVSRSRPGSLSRSSSVKVGESREALAERVKDVEAQRDALHQALKSLLERQEHQNRENQKKLRQLEMERDRALSNSPRRIGYDKEVANLRNEINILRRRAEEAIEQKWQCEKGLSGLKMDLDRAEQEIGSLRSLLQKRDILIPDETLDGTRVRSGSSHVSSESLERAYKDLQMAYAESLERVKNLELSSPKDAETASAMKQLEQSLADAISERDFAQREADSLREQSQSLRDSEKAHLSDELELADELRGSAKRVEELATQVRQQLASNATLRQRLAETIERGEKEQKTNAEKIVSMQSKLKSLEDQLMAAQQASEEKVSRHEEEIRDLKENHNVQLQRMKSGLQSPRLFAPKSPMAPIFSNSARAPRILSTSSGQAMTVSEDSKMDFLKQRVMELETALADADREMEEVVGRMNVAQIEVMELQNEREEAVRETKRLQKLIEDERMRTFEGRFATLSS
jgi:chromosome segregation ATPase